MYGKIFETTFTGSMCGAGSDVFAVWAYVIANTDGNHHIEINPVMVGALLGMSAAAVEEVIHKFCSPDPKSRTTVKDGRKLEHVSGFLYFVVNHEAYREIRNEDDRRDYFKIKKREQRARQKNGKTLASEPEPLKLPASTPTAIQLVNSSEITAEHAEGWRVKACNLGADYTAEETKHAFLALQQNSFKWAQGDWRAGLERQIGEDRKRVNGAVKASAPIGDAQKLYLAQEELTRLETEIVSLKRSYDEHSSWSREDADKLKKFRTRQKELKTILGFTV